MKSLEAIVETALWRHDLPRAIEEARQALDRRGVTIDLEARTSTGTSVDRHQRWCYVIPPAPTASEAT